MINCVCICDDVDVCVTVDEHLSLCFDVCLTPLTLSEGIILTSVSNIAVETPGKCEALVEK